MLQRVIILGMIAVIGTIVFSINPAFAATSVVWNFVGPCGDSGAPDTGPVTFTVHDDAFVGGSPTDHISVKINSTSNPSGITLSLTEDPGNNGDFTNTNLIFTDGIQLHQIGSTQTVGFHFTAQPTNPAIPDKFISGPAAVDGLWAISSSDAIGTYLNVTETGDDTKIFTSKLKLTSGPSINGSSLHVQAGDIVSIIRIDNSNQHSNELVIPNSDSTVGAISANDGDTISATYNGVKDDTPFTLFCNGPGGGGGGLIRPSLVLDILAAIGGSPYVVAPPSFGGSSYHFSDGLTLTQGSDKTVFDISHYNQEIPKQVMVTGEKVNMTFKTFESYNVNGVIHMGLYLIPRGQDMITPNSIASIVWDKGGSVEIRDLNHILSNATASSNSDNSFQYTKFSFIPTKSYDKMSFLVRAWNDHRYTIDARVHDAVETPPVIKTLPTGVIKYDSFSELQSALCKDQFYKPEIMAHIHNTQSVFPDSQGNVYWLYDTIDHSVTLVISDENDNELFSHKSSLQPYDIEKKGDYKFMKFTVQQLNRQNVEQLQNAMESEAEKAMSVAIEKRIISNSRW